MKEEHKRLLEAVADSADKLVSSAFSLEECFNPSYYGVPDFELQELIKALSELLEYESAHKEEL